jgi:leucyl-tRNA synthetase
MKYNHKEIEKKWRETWKESDIYKAPEIEAGDKKKYVLDMFPYPSGTAMHVGHAEGYIGTDILSRYYRMKGNKVLHPMGWDAFGLPAENFAIKNGVHPRPNTDKSIKTFIEQLDVLGLSYDWSREVGSHRPDYYKWTQWFFLFLYNKGLAYKKEAPVNWCDSCKTVLANEQVVNGRCERCDTEVSQKNMSQWFFKITAYADRLIDDLEKVDWPESTKINQINWIGKSEGAEVDFSLENSEKKIRIFTTRLDTIFGATFMVMSPEHKLLDKIVTDDQKTFVEEYQAQAKKKTELERTSEQDKSGVFTGAYAINPFNKKRVPIWVSDFVISTYGTGALMGVPAHDERDFEFATKFGLEIIPVIEPITGTPQENEEFRKSIVAIVINPKNNSVLSINWGKELGGNLFIGGGLEEGEDIVACAKREILEETGYKNVKYIATSEKIHHHYFAASKNVARNIEATGVYFELEDEEINDQKLEENEKDKFTVEWITVDEANKKVIDPLHKYVFDKFVNHKLYTEKEGILTNSEEFNGLTVKAAFEKLVSIAEKQGFGNRKVNYKLRDWLVSRQRYWGAPIPIVFDKEGKEHTVDESELPVILPDDVEFKPTGVSPLTDHEAFHRSAEEKYGEGARRESDTLDTFVDSSWYFFRFMDPHNEKEFADKEAMKKWGPVDVYVGGAEHTVLHLMYARFFTKVLFDEGYIDFDEPFTKLRHQGMILGEDSRKMSKRWGNVVDPRLIAEEQGIDSMRVYEMFMGPFDTTKPWSTKGLQGSRRFLDRVSRMNGFIADTVNRKIEVELNKLVKKVGDDINEFKFNTAVAEFMKFVNLVEETQSITIDVWKKFLLVLAPFAPFIAEELWQQTNKYSQWTEKNSVHSQSWPSYDEALIKDETLTIGVQINGKIRTQVEVASDDNEEAVKAKVLEIEEVQKWLKGNEPKKFIYVQGRIVNIVL